jgi:hypothetical protein
MRTHSYWWQHRWTDQKEDLRDNSKGGSKLVETPFHFFEGSGLKTNVPEPGGERILLLDLLCINQTDSSERFGQMSLKKIVYWNVANGLIFLRDERDRGRVGRLYPWFFVPRTNLLHSAHQSCGHDKSNPGNQNTNGQLGEFTVEGYQDVALYDGTLRGSVYVQSVKSTNFSASNGTPIPVSADISLEQRVEFLKDCMTGPPRKREISKDLCKIKQIERHNHDTSPWPIFQEITGISTNILKATPFILTQFPLMLGAALVWFVWLGVKAGSALVEHLEAALQCLSNPLSAIISFLKRRSSQSRVKAGQAMAISVFLFPSPVIATLANISAEQSRETKHRSSLLIVLHHEVRKLLIVSNLFHMQRIPLQSPFPARYQFIDPTPSSGLPPNPSPGQSRHKPSSSAPFSAQRSLFSYMH